MGTSRLAFALTLLSAGFSQGASIDCTSRPELCSLPVTSSNSEPDLQLAIDLVFVGDGFTSAELGAYASAVDAYINALRNEPVGRAIVGMDPTLFNFHRVDVVSATSDLGDPDPNDSAFGTIAQGTQPLQYDHAAALFAAAQNAPDVDVLVLVANTSSGWAVGTLPTGHTTGGRIAVRLSEPATLFHELGHALFGVADEYSLVNACYAGSEAMLVSFPNLTTDASGQKFSRAGVPTPVEGAHQLTRCIYRPATTCLMRSSAAALCPVCRQHFETQLAERRQGDLAAPFIAFDAPLDGATVSGRVSLRASAFDSLGLEQLSLRVDGVELAQSEPSTISFEWDSRLELNGPHQLEAFAVDLAGHQSRSAIEVFVDNPRDLTAPTVELLEPAGGEVQGLVWVRVRAEDNLKIKRVELLLDGQLLAAADEVLWDTRGAANGSHRLQARAFDYVGNEGASSELEVIVTNGRSAAAIDLDSPDAGVIEEPAPRGCGCAEAGGLEAFGALLAVASLLQRRRRVVVPKGAC